MKPEEWTEEQWKILHAPKKDDKVTVPIPLTGFGAKVDSIPPIVFPRKPYKQEVLDEQRTN